MLTQPLHIAMTNLSPTRFDSLRWDADAFHDFADVAGYNGLELHPVRSRLYGQALLGKEAVNGLVTSLHQAFRGESAADMRHYALHDRAELLRCLPAFVAMPEAIASLGGLAKVQNYLVQPVAFVGFPNKLPAGQAQAAGFSEVLVQPKAEDIQRWPKFKASKAGNLVVKGLLRYSRLNNTGICLDLAHWETSDANGNQLPAWYNSFEPLVGSGLAKEIHVGPNRTDLPGHDNGLTLRQLISDRGQQTELGQQLLLLSDLHKSFGKSVPPVVIELTAQQASSAKAATTETNQTNILKDLGSIHRDLVAKVRNLLA